MVRQVIIVALLALMLTACKKVIKVPTGAMEPTIKTGDSVVYDPLYYLTHPIGRFDIVMLKTPPSILRNGEKESFYVKRVIGLGEEQIEIKKGEVLINGQLLNEPFTFNSDDADYDFGPIKVPSGQYFLLGDNRPNSYDSRYWNPPTVEEHYIVAKVVEIKHQ